MDTVYIETTVVGNIAGRMHPDPLIAARQNVTRQWWTTAAQRYRILASEMVIDECSGGDPTAANERLQNRIVSVCRDNGFEPPVICTPEQLLEAENDSDSD